MYFRSSLFTNAAEGARLDPEKGSIAEEHPAQAETDEQSGPTRVATNHGAHRDEFLLPTPIVARPALPKSKPKYTAKKSARIEDGLRVRWARIKRLINNSSDGPSESVLEVAADTTEGSSWDKDHVETGADGEKRQHSANDSGNDAEKDRSAVGSEGIVDEIVLDRTWYASEHEKTSSAHSENGNPEKSSGQHGTSTDRESLLPHTESWWTFSTIYTFVRWRLVPWTYHFFAPSNFDPKTEYHYRKEVWYTSKPLALWSSLFFILNWVLGCALVPRPFALADNIFYFGIAVVVTVPLPLLVMFNFPRDRPWAYQTFLCLSTWLWTWYQLFFIYACGFYSNGAHKHFECGSKDFLATLYYATGLQTIAVFGLKLNRLPAMIGAVITVIFMGVFVIPDRVGWVRNLVNFVAFQVVLLYIHFMRENAERRLYNLRDQLKCQFRATQKAQVNERKAADSKRRLTSYVFHDESLVRVPLNTALIAVQNMQATSTIEQEQEVEFKALEGSLSMMSKVLNDVLDFNRMDSGRFENVSRPYQFHKVMRSMFVPLRLATNANGLELVTDLDPNIDLIARRAAYLALGESPEDVDKLVAESPDEDGMVVGDEMRLRQVITNLASNACKFTPPGGKLTITTRLIIPHPGSVETQELKSDPESADGEDSERTVGLSAKVLSQHNEHHSKAPPVEAIVVRIEVTDTGYGIRKKDMQRGKLFTAFNQTEQGRQQGGKGTGLGLALVRQIVKLSGGRLGVRSKVGEGSGSTFWVELPLGVGEKAVSQSADEPFDQELRSEQILGAQMANATARNGPHSALQQGQSYSSTSDAGTVSTLVDNNGSKANSSAHPTPPQPSSALKTIMEQGGLVELAPNKNRDVDGPLPTRTLGDLSNGAGSLYDMQPSPTIEQQPEKCKDSSRTPQRPTYVELPEPTFASARPSPSSAATSTPGRHPLSTPKSEILEVPLRVLVVDDDHLTRKLMRRMLMRLGCNVSTAENGAVAYELITTNQVTPASENAHAPSIDPSASVSIAQTYDGPRYEVVFLDNQMPVMSGIMAVRKLRNEQRTDFIVGVTGNALLTDQQEYLDAGVDYVITKPVFEASLKNMLGIAHERRKRRSQIP